MEIEMDRGIEDVMKQIAMRAKRHPDDTTEDRLRDLRHIKSLASAALSKIEA